MSKRKLHDLIEAYLDGSLPPAERLETEQRMATDEAFRREVELHRQMQEHFTDPRRQRLKKALSEVMGKPEPPVETDAGNPKVSPFALTKYVALLALLLAAGFFFWQKSQPPAPPAEPARQEAAPPAEVPSPPGAPTKTTAPPSPAPPVAAADLRRFEPNPAMEALVNSGSRSNDLTLRMDSPAPGAVFQPGKNGSVEVRFSGVLGGLPDGEIPALNLLIFNNMDANTPLFSLPLAATPDASGKAVFSLSKTLPLQPGLYYFSVETAEGDVAGAGKFWVKN